MLAANMHWQLAATGKKTAKKCEATEALQADKPEIGRRHRSNDLRSAGFCSKSIH